jgi:hypothetical protein
MIGRTSRRLFVVLLGAGLALTGTAGAATAAQAGTPPLRITATDMTYGQPDLTGFRLATTTVTVTNTTRHSIEYPALTYADNGRDGAMHGDWHCATAHGNVNQVTCVIEPLAAGQTRSLDLPFGTYKAGPAGSARLRADVGSDSQGTPVPGTRSVVAWHVAFAPLVGTFGLATEDMNFGDRDAQGARHAVLKVTLTNLTDQTIGFPRLTFPNGSGDPDLGTWSDCVATYPQPDEATGCVTEPLAAGERRIMTFPFSLPTSVFSHPDLLMVEAATSAEPDAPVLPGTAAGSTYNVNSPGDDG